MDNNVIRLSETVDMVNLTVLMTSKCTLKCKLCATYVPLQKHPFHYTYETLTKSVERFLTCVKKSVGIVSIGGGEPLCHPELTEFMDYLLKYSNKIKMIEIATNGTIVPDEKLLSVMRKYDNLNVLLDNYGEKLSPKTSEIIQAFESNSIPYRLRNYTAEDSWSGGWIDVSDFSEKGRSEKEVTEHFKKCGFNTLYSNIYFLINGVAHICYATKQLLDFIDENPDESVNLLDYSKTDEEIWNQLKNLRNRDSLCACKNCNGFLFESEHKIPAEQM